MRQEFSPYEQARGRAGRRCLRRPLSECPHLGLHSCCLLPVGADPGRVGYYHPSTWEMWIEFSLLAPAWDLTRGWELCLCPSKKRKENEKRKGETAEGPFPAPCMRGEVTAASSSG